MRVAMAQLNPIVGDVAGNAALIADAIARAAREQCDLLVLPEMVLLGYPPRDLLLRSGVIESVENALAELATIAPATLTVVIGHPARATGGLRAAANVLSIIRDGKVIARCTKRYLPGYDVFDEDRYFEPGNELCMFSCASKKVGVLLCEDFWRARDVAGGEHVVPGQRDDLAQQLAAHGCSTLIIPSASPFVIGKGARHRAQLIEAARATHMSIIMVNQVGANDDLIFDGRSLAIDALGNVVHAAPGFVEHFAVVEADRAPSGSAVEVDPDGGLCAEIFDALVLGIRDYVRKTGHARVTIGLSGGIDSAITAVLAAAAIGPSNITGVLMPSRHSSAGSISDAQDLAARLDIDSVLRVPIEAMHEEARTSLAAALEPPLSIEGIVDENAQARLRAVILMAVSNADGSLVLATGNKSEMAMGYTTLYGDMAGALAVIGDLYKTQVYELARWINREHRLCGFVDPPIPEASISKAPSAELRADQTDQDSLPPYDILDSVLVRHVDGEESIDEIASATGLEHAFVTRICKAVDRNEYKRRQAAIVLKLQPRTFGPGRPMPVAART
ncbi:MAG: NAD+ synthase [Phycisphaerales bacterium]